MELTDDRDNILLHIKTDEYSPEEGSINGVVGFVKVHKAYYILRNLFLPCHFLWPKNHKHNIDGRTVQSETNVFLRQDPGALAVLTEAASDYLQQYLAGVAYQRATPAVAALGPTYLCGVP